MSCNTNNGTERINRDLKHDELEGFKNCTLSELLEIIITKFLPKLYRKYVFLNVKYSSEYKRYTDVVPNFLQNRPRELVKFLLERSQRVSTRMIESVKETANGVFCVLSDDPGISNEEKEYTVVFGDQETFCSCTCRDFRRTRLLCKHFFAVIESNKKQFHDISQLFRDHNFTNLDGGLFGNNEVNENIINESKAAIESPDPEVDDAEVNLHCSDNIGNF